MTAPIEASRTLYLAMRERLLTDLPELADDHDCLLDTLDGLTDFTDQLAEITRSAVNDEALAGGIDAYMSKLQERKTSLRQRAQRKRQLVLHYMEDMSIKKITAPDLTISRRSVPPSVIITDETKIPKEFIRVAYAPDKAAIKEALKAGEIVAGATLSNGSETLAVKI